MDNIKQRALQKVCDKAVLLDETREVKEAIIWKMLYNGAEDERETVLSMSKEQINTTLLRYNFMIVSIYSTERHSVRQWLTRVSFFWLSFEPRMAEVQLIMQRKEHWVTLWMHPQTGLSKYKGYDPNAFNGVVVGVSGHGK